MAKRAEHGRGSYDRPWLELNGRYAFAAGPTVDVNLLTESRRYLRVDSLRSTIHQDELRARTVLPVSERSRTEWSLHLANVQYATSSSVFQDHVSGDVDAIFAVAIDRQGPRSASEPAPNDTWKEEQDADSLLFALELDELLEPGAEMDLAELLRPRLSLGLGFHGEILRNERAGDADYDVVAAVVSLAREASAGLWFDFRTEVGRRDYRGSGASGGLIFEGLDLSLAGSDFRFVSATVLVEVPLPLSCKVSGFGQLDREWHDVDADDFTLWLTTLAVTRSF